MSEVAKKISNWVAGIIFFASIILIFVYSYVNQPSTVSLTTTNVWYIANIAYIYPFSQEQQQQIIILNQGYVSPLLYYRQKYYLSLDLKIFFPNVTEEPKIAQMYLTDISYNFKYLNQTIYQAKLPKRKDFDIIEFIFSTIVSVILIMIASGVMAFIAFWLTFGLVYSIKWTWKKCLKPNPMAHIQLNNV